MTSKKVVIIVGLITISLVVSWFEFSKLNSATETPVQILPLVQNPYIQEYQLSSNSAPNGLIVDKHGTVWITSSKSNTLYSLDSKSNQLKTFNIGKAGSLGENTTMIWTMAEGNDGEIWFSPLGTKTIWRFDPLNDITSELYSQAGSAFQMKSDPNTGNIWFTTLSGNTIGVIEKNPEDQEKYSIQSFDLGNETGPAGLFLQGTSAIWVAEITNEKVVKYNINLADGHVKTVTREAQFPVGNKTELSSPSDVIVSGNSIWLTEHGTSFLTEYHLDSNQVVRYPTSRNAFDATTLPFWLREVNDGRSLWFNEHEGNKLAYFDTENKTMVEYEIPSRPSGGILTYPLNIATDPNDKMILWFSEWNTDKVGRIDGHKLIPFSITANTSKVTLSDDASKEVTISLQVTGQSPYSANKVFLNASSSLLPNADLGNLNARFSKNTLDLDSEHDSQLFLRNYAEKPGNYTLGISVSNGIVTKTIFLDLIVPGKKL